MLGKKNLGDGTGPLRALVVRWLSLAATLWYFWVKGIRVGLTANAGCSRSVGIMPLGVWVTGLD